MPLKKLKEDELNQVSGGRAMNAFAKTSTGAKVASSKVAASKVAASKVAATKVVAGIKKKTSSKKKV